MYDKQSIVVHFKGWINSLEPVHRLSEQLREVLNDNSLGIFDGHEIAMDGSHGSLFVYGLDSKALFEIVKPFLVSADLLKCTQAILRSGTSERENNEIIIDL
ncbi:hypothetical protein [Ekhidna sp.]